MRGWAWIFEGRGEEGPRTDWLWHSSLAHSQRVRMICVAVGPKTEANFEDILRRVQIRPLQHLGDTPLNFLPSPRLMWAVYLCSNWRGRRYHCGFVHCRWGKFCPGIHADGAKPASTWPEGELSSVIDFAPAWTISKCFSSLLKNTQGLHHCQTQMSGLSRWQFSFSLLS